MHAIQNECMLLRTNECYSEPLNVYSEQMNVTQNEWLLLRTNECYSEPLNVTQHHQTLLRTTKCYSERMNVAQSEWMLLRTNECYLERMNVILIKWMLLRRNECFLKANECISEQKTNQIVSITLNSICIVSKYKTDHWKRQDNKFVWRKLPCNKWDFYGLCRTQGNKSTWLDKVSKL